MTMLLKYNGVIDPLMGFGKDGKGAIIRERVLFTVGALGASTGILSTGGSRVSDSLGDDFRVLKSEIVWSKQDQTSDQSTLVLYMVDGELSLVECEECIENGGPLDRNDRDQQERAERWVKPVGMLLGSTDITSTNGPVIQRPVEIKPGWTFSNSEAWDWMVYNNSATALTTGTVIVMLVTHYGVWVT